MVWFRSDLRTRDNAALFHASHAATRGVVGVFVVSPGEWRAHDWAGVKVEFALRGVAALSASLAEFNIPLRVVVAETAGEIPATLLALAKETGCDCLHANIEHEVNEARRDARVGEVFTAAGMRASFVHDQTFAPPGAVLTGQGRPYTVFTPFKRAMYAKWTAEGVPKALGDPKKQDAKACAASAVPEKIEGFASRVPAAMWSAGEIEAMRRLRVFVKERVAEYEARRDLPAEEGTSVLSPYLALGMVSARQCLQAALMKDGGPEAQGAGAATWISELVWREFYIQVMAAFPRVCMGRAFKVETERVAWRKDAGHLAAWQEGRTGVPIVDAGMRQLAATGWMHNRVRMIVASYLTKNLLMDWREGERWFMRNLVDGFLASNNGGWQWSASTGTDASPYFRVFNPVSQGTRFDPAGVYVRRWVPALAGLSAAVIHEPWELPPLARAGLEYPEPLVDLTKSRARAIEAFRNL